MNITLDWNSCITNQNMSFIISPMNTNKYLIIFFKIKIHTSQNFNYTNWRQNYNTLKTPTKLGTIEDTILN